MPNELFSLKDEVAVVIGGTGVLGGGMADALAAAGAKVAVLGRSEERGKARVKEIEDAGGTAMFHTADALSRMRELTSSVASLRIVWGGKISGAAGWLPGIAEEVMCSVTSAPPKPVLILGGFGGCARRRARSCPSSTTG